MNLRWAFQIVLYISYWLKYEFVDWWLIFRNCIRTTHYTSSWLSLRYVLHSHSVPKNVNCFRLFGCVFRLNGGSDPIRQTKLYKRLIPYHLWLPFSPSILRLHSISFQSGSSTPFFSTQNRYNLVKQTSTSGLLFKSLYLCEIQYLIQNSSLEDWSFTYTSSFTNPHSWYSSLHPQLLLEPSYTYFSNLRRSSIIKLDPLRFVNNRPPPHLHRFGLSPSPYCPLHPSEQQTASLNHLFFTRPNFNTTQQTLYSSLLAFSLPTPITLSDILSSHNLLVF